jgi:hypothetical protein
MTAGKLHLDQPPTPRRFSIPKIRTPSADARVFAMCSLGVLGAAGLGSVQQQHRHGRFRPICRPWTTHRCRLGHIHRSAPRPRPPWARKLTMLSDVPVGGIDRGQGSAASRFVVSQPTEGKGRRLLRGPASHPRAGSSRPRATVRKCPLHGLPRTRRRTGKNHSRTGRRHLPHALPSIAGPRSSRAPSTSRRNRPETWGPVIRPSRAGLSPGATPEARSRSSVTRGFLTPDRCRTGRWTETILEAPQ